MCGSGGNACRLQGLIVDERGTRGKIIIILLRKNMGAKCNFTESPSANKVYPL